MMHAVSRKFFFSLIRRLNKHTGQRKIETFSFQNVQKSPEFYSESPWSLRGVGFYRRALVPLQLQTGFRSFTAIPQDSRDEDSELDACGMKEDKGLKDAISNKAPSLASIFSYQDVTKNVKSVASVPSEKHKKKSLQSPTSIIYENKETKSVKSVPYISSKETEKKHVKSEQEKMRTTKAEKKAERVSYILEHPWPEWVQFLEHLNERGYLSKAFHFQGPIVLQGLSTEGIYAFIEFAAFSFALDHIEISNYLQLHMSPGTCFCTCSLKCTSQFP